LRGGRSRLAGIARDEVVSGTYWRQEFNIDGLLLYAYKLNNITMKLKQQGKDIMNLHEIAAIQLKNKDLIKLSEQAKEKSMLLLDEQGISALALALSNTLVDLVQHPEKIKA